MATVRHHMSRHADMEQMPGDVIKEARRVCRRLPCRRYVPPVVARPAIVVYSFDSARRHHIRNVCAEPRCQTSAHARLIFADTEARRCARSMRCSWAAQKGRRRDLCETERRAESDVARLRRCPFYLRRRAGRGRAMMLRDEAARSSAPRCVE